MICYQSCIDDVSSRIYRILWKIKRIEKNENTKKYKDKNESKKKKKNKCKESHERASNMKKYDVHQNKIVTRTR